MEVTLRGHPAEIRIVHIQKDLVRSPSQIVIKLSLCSHYTFEAAEAQEMRLSDIGDESIVRQSDIHQFLYVSRMACAHLHHCYLSLRIDLQKGKRDTYAVVEVALSGCNCIFCRKDCTDEFLGRSLSVCTGKGHNGKWLSIHKGHGPVPAGKFLKGLQGVLYHDKTRVC